MHPAQDPHIQNNPLRPFCMVSAAFLLPVFLAMQVSCATDGFASPRYSAMSRAERPVVSSIVATVLRKLRVTFR